MPYRSKNRQFVPTPVSYIALARGDPFRISGRVGYFQKLECSGSLLVKKVMTLYFLPFYIPECDGRTDRRTSLLWLYQRLCNLLYATALVKKTSERKEQ